MKKAVCTELQKMLHSKMLYLSIAVGLLFCVMDIKESFVTMQTFDDYLQWAAGSDTRLGTGHEGYSLFYNWMGVIPISQGAHLFYTVWPVLVAMAYGWSYLDDRRSGVYNQIVSRTGAKTYYTAKYIAVFIAGGLAVGFPVLINLLGNALVYPYAIPIDGPVFNCNFLSELYYTHPWAYGLTWCGMTFLCGGVAACLCFVVGTKMRHGVMVILTPYALYVALAALITNLRMTAFKDVALELSPLRLINSVPGFANPEWLVFGILGLLTLISFGVGYWQVVKHELA